MNSLGRSGQVKQTIMRQIQYFEQEEAAGDGERGSVVRWPSSAITPSRKPQSTELPSAEHRDAPKDETIENWAIIGWVNHWHWHRPAWGAPERPWQRWVERMRTNGLRMDSVLFAIDSVCVKKGNSEKRRWVQTDAMGGRRRGQSTGTDRREGEEEQWIKVDEESISWMKWSKGDWLTSVINPSDVSWNEREKKNEKGNQVKLQKYVWNNQTQVFCNWWIWQDYLLSQNKPHRQYLLHGLGK